MGEGWQESPYLTGEQTKAREQARLPKGRPGMQKGVSEPAGLAGLDTLPVASAQLCGSGFGPGTMPSPHHSSSKPPSHQGF